MAKSALSTTGRSPSKRSKVLRRRARKSAQENTKSPAPKDRFSYDTIRRGLCSTLNKVVDGAKASTADNPEAALVRQQKSLQEKSWKTNLKGGALIAAGIAGVVATVAVCGPAAIVGALGAPLWGMGAVWGSVGAAAYGYHELSDTLGANSPLGAEKMTLDTFMENADLDVSGWTSLRPTKENESKVLDVFKIVDDQRQVEFLVDGYEVTPEAAVNGLKDDKSVSVYRKWGSLADEPCEMNDAEDLKFLAFAAGASGESLADQELARAAMSADKHLADGLRNYQQGLRDSKKAEVLKADYSAGKLKPHPSWYRLGS